MIITNSGTIVESTQYKNEDELQGTLFELPQLLEKNNKLFSIKREVSTEAGPIDVLMIDNHGKLTVVEVKLNRNGESRRRVAAQLIDYVSAISKCSYFELNENTNGKLDEIIKTLPNAENLPNIIENNLRAGNVRLVIAIDKSNDDLLRIMQFLEEHTDFELDLFEIQKNVRGDEVLYQTNAVIKSSPNESQRGEQKSNQILDELQEIWNEKHELKADGSAYSYRQIRVPGWRSSVHYEFTKQNRNHFVEVRLDNEISHDLELAKRISNVLEKFNGKEVEGYQLTALRGKNGNQIRQLAAQIDIDDAKEMSSKAMEKLIELTKEEVDAVFKNR